MTRDVWFDRTSDGESSAVGVVKGRLQMYKYNAHKLLPGTSEYGKGGTNLVI